MRRSIWRKAWSSSAKPMRDLLVRLDTLAKKEKVVLNKGYAVRRAAAFEKPVVLEWVGKTFSPKWAGEADVAFSRQPISCFIALHQERIVGFACYEVTSRGFFGPTGVDKNHEGKQLGTTLLLESLCALKAMGYVYAFIGGVGPAEFYVKAVGAVEIPGTFKRD